MRNFSTTRIPGPLGARIGFHRQGFGAANRKPLKKPAFSKIDRTDFAITLSERRMSPGLINQSNASLCGPASLMYIVANDNPDLYEQYATDLYETGKAKLGSLEVSPGEDCRAYDPTGKISAADWVALASLRDSENAIFDYDEADDALAGITLPGQLSDWLESAGYHHVSNETNLYFTKGEDDFRHAAQLLSQGYRVCLFIDMNGVSSGGNHRGRLRQIFTTANHWVVLKSVTQLTQHSVQFTIYTWGNDNHSVPNSAVTMSMDYWLQNFYGYVAGKP